MDSRSHARLGPSAAHRWIHCPASIRLAESLEIEGHDTSSVYAAEGTAAHTVAELVASHRFGKITDEMLDAALAVWRASNDGADWLQGNSIEDAQEEMLIHAEAYADLIEIEAARQHGSVVTFEQRVSTGVEHVWGTADTGICGPDILTIVDFKYGTGVRVDAPGNEQLMFYGLGVYESDLLGFATTIRMVIFQPRLDHISEWEIPVAQLLEWRDNVAKPAAALALSDDAPFGPSEEACRFCPARGVCKAQTAWITQLDFGQDIDAMDGDDFAAAIAMLPAVSAWATAVEEKALDRIYEQGKDIPGYKVVRSGKNRKILDEDEAIDRLVAAGYKREDVERTKTSIQTFAVLDKVVRVGKTKVLDKVLGDVLGETSGRPSLVPADDKRPAITAALDAASEFDDGFEDT